MTPTSTGTPKRLLYVANEDFAFLLNRLPMARAARAAGYEVHVATRVNKDAKAIEAEGFVLHPIPFRRGGLSPFAALPTILALRRVWREIRPRIVHHAGLQCCVYGSLAALGKKTNQVNAITGLGYIFTTVSWRTRLLKASISLILPWLLNRRTSIVLVQNPDDRAALVDLGVRRERIVLIPGSGVDTDALQPLPEPDGAITFGFAGRLLTDKGIRALVAAHGLLREQGHDVRLIIAGNPDPANPASVRREEVEDWAKRPGITWLGHITDIASLWRMCHFAVLPSHREGLPVSLLEAAACGKPMIATDAPGCREIVIEDLTGLRVPIENPPALADAILRLAKSPEVRRRYGRAARELVVNKLSARIIGASIVKLYGAMPIDRPPAVRPAPAIGDLAESGKIMLITQHYAPFPSTTSGYMTEIAEELARHHRVTVISSTPGCGALSSTEDGRPEVIEVKSWWPSKSALVSRSLASILFSVQVFLAVIRRARPSDAVLSVTTPFTIPYAVTFAARLKKAASALIIYDLYPDTLVMTGFLHPSSILTRWLRLANQTMFNWLDAVVVIGRDMSAKLLEYKTVTPAKIDLIPNWATLPAQYREPTSENAYRKPFNGRFVVAMSGNAGFTHDPVSVFEAAKILGGERNVEFMLSGEGVGWTKMRELQAASPLANVKLVERVADSELESFLCAGDVWIIPYRKGNTGVSVPSRIYNLLAIGRPIIICSEPDAEAAMLVREEDVGWVVPPEDPQAIAQAISEAASSPETREKGRRAVRVAARYSRQIALRAYEDLMDGLLEKQRSRHQDLIKRLELPFP
jgi:glycosyltransferase involved in cell wall biosynthesis